MLVETKSDKKSQECDSIYSIRELRPHERIDLLRPVRSIITVHQTVGINWEAVLNGDQGDITKLTPTGNALLLALKSGSSALSWLKAIVDHAISTIEMPKSLQSTPRR